MRSERTQQAATVYFIYNNFSDELFQFFFFKDTRNNNLFHFIEALCSRLHFKSLRRTGVRSQSARFNWRTDDLFYKRITKNLGVDF